MYLNFLATGCKEEEFTWTNYLKMTKAQVAPKEVFATPGRVAVSLRQNQINQLEALLRPAGAHSWSHLKSACVLFRSM